MLNKLRGRDDFMTVLFSDGSIYLRKPETERLRRNEGTSQAAREEAILNKTLSCFPSHPVQVLRGHPSSLTCRWQMGTHGRLSSGSSGRPCLVVASPGSQGVSPSLSGLQGPGYRCWSIFSPPSWLFLPSCLSGVPFVFLTILLD